MQPLASPASVSWSEGQASPFGRRHAVWAMPIDSAAASDSDSDVEQEVLSDPISASFGDDDDDDTWDEMLVHHMRKRSQRAWAT